VKGLEKPVQKCKQCDKPLPQPKQKTPRERQYCNDLCRQRAHREKHTWKNNVNRAKVEAKVRFFDSIQVQEMNGLWDSKMRDCEVDGLERSNRTLELLLENAELDCEIAKSDLKGEIEQNKRIEAFYKKKIAELEAEIVRLNVLLEAKAKRKR
jgi:hypothetical protein